VVTSTYQVSRRVDHDVTCRLELRDQAGVQDSQNILYLGPFNNQPSTKLVWEGGSLSASAHVGEGARARRHEAAQAALVELLAAKSDA
jgi:hypothetical protein